MKNSIHSLLPPALLLSIWIWVTQAQDPNIQWIYPLTNPPLVNYIDTLYFQWISTYQFADLIFFCQGNTTIGSGSYDIVSQITVDPTGEYPYLFAKDAAGRTEFPYACFVKLTPNGQFSSGSKSPASIVFTSQSALSPITFSPLPTSTSSAVVKTISTASSTVQANASSSAGQTSTIGAGNSTSTVIQTSGFSTSQKTSATSTSSSNSASSSATSLNTSRNITSTHRNNTGPIIGGVLGGSALLPLIIFGAVFLKRHGTKIKSPKETQNQTDIITSGLNDVNIGIKEGDQNKEREQEELHGVFRMEPAELHHEPLVELYSEFIAELPGDIPELVGD